jgi:hypothetical protein
LPAPAGLKEFLTMLGSLPGAGVWPETLDGVRAVRRAVEALLPESTGEPAAGPDTAAAPRPLTGSVCLDLAITDPDRAAGRPPRRASGPPWDMR